MSTIGRTLRVLSALLTGGAVIAAAAVITAARPEPSPAESMAARATVVAELFTSEGCSSCPAADDLLRDWLATQPIPGVELVALGEHVDYWDRLGWRDPFSSPDFSARQSAYDAAVFRSGRIYTPQLVLDGQFEAIGSDRPAVRRAVLAAARQAKASVTVVAASTAGDRTDVLVRVDVPAAVPRQGPADVLVAITEDGLATRVPRGENGGRTLRHAAVTRSLTTVGVLEARAPRQSLAASIPLDEAWARPNLRVVAFLQESSSRRILGAATTALDATTARRGAGR